MNPKEFLNQVQPNEMVQARNTLLNLHDFIRVPISNLRFIVATILVSLSFGFSYAFFWPPTYQATTTVKVPQNTGSDTSMLKMLVSGMSSQDEIQTYEEICNSWVVARQAATLLNLNVLPQYQKMTSYQIAAKIRKMIKVHNVFQSNILSIQVQSGDSQFSSDLANAWAQAFIQVNLDLSHKGAFSKRKFLEDQAQQTKLRLANPNLRLNDESKADEIMYGQLLASLQQARLAENVDDAGIVVVDPAVKPEKPISPKKTQSVLIAFFVGLIASLQLAFFSDRLRDRIKLESTLKEITGLPIYAVVPDFREDYPEGFNPPTVKEKATPKSLIHNSVFNHAYYRESFKVLRTNLIFAQADKPIKVLMAISAGPGEGKTLINSNLAISLAQWGKKTLLVDADLRKSSVRKIFGLQVEEEEIGLPLALTGQRRWAEMVIASGVENLDIFPNTVTPPNPAELLGSVAMKRLIEEMRDDYEYVVFDGAPVMPVTDSVVLASLLDGVVLIARFEVTRSADLVRSLENLRRVGTKVVGTVLNSVAIKKGLYGYGYGFGYGYGSYKYREESKAIAKK